MRRSSTSLLLGVALGALFFGDLALGAGSLGSVAVSAAAAPVHTLSVSGTGVGLYPGFTASVQRYAVTTTGGPSGTGGAVTVHASTSDPAGVVRVDGRVAPGGVAQVTGLEGGDEISVFIEDSAGVEVHSLVYLPAGFPALEVVTSSAGVAPGQIGLTLKDFQGGPVFATTVDRNGVPTHVEVVPDGYDLKQQPDGSISLSEPTTTPGRTGEAVVVLDPRWREVARHETVAGLTNTDLHDSILLPDGSRFLMAYEANPVTGKNDNVIQKVNADGTEAFRWSSADLVDESVRPSSDPDYAHMNSMYLMPDGDIVASFRHLSAVLRIATVAHGSYAPGDIVWKLGGRDSSFAFVDDPYGGPCAQHTASVLPNGHVLVFDDGSGGFADHLCVDQSDPTGPTVDRDPWQSRVAEYALDPAAHTATLVWDYAPPGWYSWFMGSATRLANGNTLVGWAAAVQALASELSPAGDLLWELRLAPVTTVPAPAPYLSYRASLMNVPDAEPPQIHGFSMPSDVVVEVGADLRFDYSCTDRGGSSLRSCGGTVRPGEPLDTTLGSHAAHVTATDGAGHTTTASVYYSVVNATQPAVHLHRPGGRVLRDGLERVVRAGHPLRLLVSVSNEGVRPDSYILKGTHGTGRFAISYRVAGAGHVTRAVTRGRFVTPRLSPLRDRLEMVVVVRRKALAESGDRRTLRLRAAAGSDPSVTDELVVRLVAR